MNLRVSPNRPFFFSFVAALAISAGWPGSTAQAHPVFESANVVNAASYLPSDLPGGGIARGAGFSIFGAALGPSESRIADSFPLPTSLGGVTVTVSGPDGSPHPAVLTFVSRAQINAIMPSGAPLGQASLRVTFDDGDGGPTSVPVPIRIVEAGFGIYTANRSGDGPASAHNFISQDEQPHNAPSIAAQPGQYATLWGTGLGAAAGSDDLPPAGQDGVFDRAGALGLQVFVGLARSTDVLYAGRSPQFPGLDQIVFRIPDDAPLGCYTPVAVRAGGLVSNFATLSIGLENGPCEDALNPYWSATGDMPAIGVAALSRLALQAGGALSISDSVSALFGRPGSRDRHFSPSLSIPPLGACTSYATRNTPGGLATREFPMGLDAGSSLSIRGPRGEQRAPAVIPGAYQNNLAPSNAPPGFLESGDYFVQSAGGAQVGPFLASARLPAPPQWQLPDGRVVPRSQPLRVTWQPGGRGDEYIWIFGVASDSASLTTNVTTTFFCAAADADAAITVPVEILANLPLTIGSGDVTTAELWVGRHSLPAANRFQAGGLDYAFLDTLAAAGVPIETR